MQSMDGAAEFYPTTAARFLSLLCAGACAAALAFSASFAQPGSFAQILRYVGVLCFAAQTFLALRAFASAVRPMLVMTETGFTDYRWAAKEIPWTDIDKIEISTSSGHKILTLDVDPAHPSLNWSARVSLRVGAWLAPRVGACFSPPVNAWFGIGKKGLSISTLGLDVDLDTLHGMLAARMRAARPLATP